MQVIFARMSLDEIVKDITVELKLNARNEAHVQNRHGQGHRGHREYRDHQVKGDKAGSAEDRTGSSEDDWTQEEQEEGHFFAFVAHNMREQGQDRSRWNRLESRFHKNRKEPRRIGNLPLSFREHRSQQGGCWVCYREGNNDAHDHSNARYRRQTRKSTSPPILRISPKQPHIANWKAKGGDVGKGKGRGQGKGGEKGFVAGPGQERRVRSIEEVAEDMLRTSNELKAQQCGGQSHGAWQPECAAANQV